MIEKRIMEIKNLDKLLKKMEKDRASVHFKLKNKEIFNVKIKEKEILVDVKDFIALLKRPYLAKFALSLKGNMSSKYKIKLKKSLFKRMFNKE